MHLASNDNNDDTFVCAACDVTLTSLEDYARHKYTVHNLRFQLTKSFSTKPCVFYPVLVKRGPVVSKLTRTVSLGGETNSSAVNPDGTEEQGGRRKSRMTFTKGLVAKGKEGEWNILSRKLYDSYLSTCKNNPLRVSVNVRRMAARTICVCVRCA